MIFFLFFFHGAEETEIHERPSLFARRESITTADSWYRNVVATVSCKYGVLFLYLFCSSLFLFSLSFSKPLGSLLP